MARDTWTIIGVYVTATAVFITIMLYLHSLNRDDIGALTQQVDMVRTGIDDKTRGLSERIGELTKRVDDVIGQLSVMSGNLGSIEANVTELKGPGVERLETSIRDVRGDLIDLKQVVAADQRVQADLKSSIAKLEERSITVGSLVSLAVDKLEGQQFFVGHERDDATKSFTYRINPITGKLHYFDSLTDQPFKPKDPLYFDPNSGLFTDEPLWK